LNRLINDVASASRLDAELARQHMQRIDVRNVLESVHNLFLEMLSDDKRRLRLIIEPGLPSSFTVRGNDGRLAQVFTNLIDNALSFSPNQGTVSVLVRPNGLNIDIVVEDDGPGIPPDKLGQIFDRFYSDRPQTDAKRGKNSGLGLSISKEIVLSHNGQIYAENRPSGQNRPAGARFVVRLPLAADAGAGLVRRS
jgi:two-component system sensor histidine kinase ChvG